MKSIVISLLVVLGCQYSFAQHKHDIPATSEFEVKGLVKHAVKFSIDKLSGFRQDSIGEVVFKNKRGETKGTAKNVKGILLTSFIDSADINVEKPKEYSELNIILTASDGYRNVYSWNELYNTEGGKHVYLITEMDGLTIGKMENRIMVMSLGDINCGARHIKGLTSVEVKKVD